MRVGKQQTISSYSRHAVSGELRNTRCVWPFCPAQATKPTAHLRCSSSAHPVSSENLGLAVVRSLSPVKIEFAPAMNIIACACVQLDMFGAPNGSHIQPKERNIISEPAHTR